MCRLTDARCCWLDGELSLGRAALRGRGMLCGGCVMETGGCKPARCKLSAGQPFLRSVVHPLHDTTAGLKLARPHRSLWLSAALVQDVASAHSPPTAPETIGAWAAASGICRLGSQQGSCLELCRVQNCLFSRDRIPPTAKTQNPEFWETAAPLDASPPSLDDPHQNGMTSIYIVEAAGAVVLPGAGLPFR